MIVSFQIGPCRAMPCHGMPCFMRNVRSLHPGSIAPYLGTYRVLALEARRYGASSFQQNPGVALGSSYNLRATLKAWEGPLTDERLYTKYKHCVHLTRHRWWSPNLCSLTHRLG